MNILKRLFIFLLWNLLILITIWIIIFLINNIFWIYLWWYYIWNNLINVFIFALVIWFSWSFINLFISKWLAKKIYNIELINEEDFLRRSRKEMLVYTFVNKIASENNIKSPEVWFYNSQEPNAFATWYSKNNSLVAVSTWLLDTMNENEIEWVIAHEMAHILNWDMVTMTLLQWLINTFVVFLSRIIASIANSIFKSNSDSSNPSWIYYLISFILDMVLTLLASLLIMWFSRHREYKADEGGSLLVWKEKMIKALEKLKVIQDKIINIEKDQYSTMKIFWNKQWWIISLFSTHPSLDMRIENLRNK